MQRRGSLSEGLEAGGEPASRQLGVLQAPGPGPVESGGYGDRIGATGGPGDGLRTLNMTLPLPLLSLPIEYELYHVEEEVW